MGGAVQDDPERPVLVVLNDQYHAAQEVAVGQVRRGDEEMSSQRVHRDPSGEVTALRSVNGPLQSSLRRRV